MKLRQFTHESKISASAGALFEWHENDAAFERLVPSGQPVKLLHKDPGLSKGVRAEIEMGYPPFSLKWLAEHTQCDPGRSFTDKQIKGPCSFWEHQHEMIPVSDHESLLRDTVTYRVPLGFDIDSNLEKLFRYRHHVTSSDLFMATHFPLSASTIGVIGDLSEYKQRLLSLLHVLGQKTSEQPPFETVVVFGDKSLIPKDADTVIHISQEPTKNEVSCRRYLCLIPSNVLWPAFGLLKVLMSQPMWINDSTLADVEVQWISLDDAVYGIYFALSQRDLHGTYSLSVPETFSLRDFYRKLRAVNSLSLSLRATPLPIRKFCDSPSLCSLGAPIFSSNFRELIEIL